MFPVSIPLYFPDSPLKLFSTHLSTTEFNVILSVTGIFFSDKSIHFSKKIRKKITREDINNYAILTLVLWHVEKGEFQKDRQCTYNITLRRVRVITVAVEKQ